MYYTKFDTWLCEIFLVGDEQGLQYLHLNTGEGKRKRFSFEDNWTYSPSFFSKTEKQIKEYLSGTRKKFDIKLAPKGTEFQKKVWQTLRTIPYGKTVSYGDVAKMLGKPKAARAVGTANGQNPIPLIIPCHRVIGANGRLAGFAHGTVIKEKLINHEQW